MILKKNDRDEMRWKKKKKIVVNCLTQEICATMKNVRESRWKKAVWRVSND